MKIQLFAGLKDIIGESTLEFSIETENGPCSLNELKASLIERFPAAENLIQSSRFAINQSYQSDDYVLENSGQEIALIPPVSGG